MRDEWTRAAGGHAQLVGWRAQTVYTQSTPVKKRTELKLTKQTEGYRAIGTIEDRVILVPGFLGVDNKSSPLACAKAPMAFDGSQWRVLGGTAGDDSTRANVVGSFVIWGGRVFRFTDGTLVATDAGDLPRGDAEVVAIDDGFVTAGGGKLIVVTRHGKQREDRSVGKLAIESVLRFEDKLLLYDGARYHAYDLETRAHEPFDLGVTSVDALVAVPCGLVALVDKGRYLKLLRSSA
jgi:hypothetical protein